MISSRPQLVNASCNSLETCSLGRMPDFLIIGAMKSGTTSFFYLLGKHPKIFLPYWKELQFFSRDHNFKQGEKYYLQHFADAREDQILGEASTCYSRWPHYPHAAERIAERLPDVRLIYLMRHPVERAYSHYGHLMQQRIARKNASVLTFEEALAEDQEIINASQYKMQIERYLPLFSRDQMLFLTFDELKASPDTLLEKTQSFLGIDPINLTARGQVKVNQWEERVSRDRIYHFFQVVKRSKLLSGVVKKTLSRETRNQLRKKAVRSEFFLSLFGAGLDKKKYLSPLTQKTRERLLEHLEESTCWLENFLGWDLSDWHK